MLVVCTYENTTNRRAGHGMAVSNRMRSIEVVSKHVWSLYIWKHSTPICHQEDAFSPLKWAAHRHYRSLFGVCSYENTEAGRGTKCCKQEGQENNIMIKTYGKWGVCRCAWVEFPDTSMQLQLHESKTGSLTRLSPNCTKPIMPRHSMTFSRRQNKHLKTPATLETSGSTSAVSSHRLSAWKATCTNSWMHRHGAACGKRFASRPSTEIMLLETHQSSDNPLCSNPAASTPS